MENHLVKSFVILAVYFLVGGIVTCIGNMNSVRYKDVPSGRIMITVSAFLFALAAYFS